jgi:2-oxoglutarate ferredoxin oxidoreductase subunit delta
MAQGTIRIDQERCKGCDLCVTFCPQHVIILNETLLNAKGYHPAQLNDPHNECTGCAVCAVVCPDVCITVYREPLKRREGALREVKIHG